MSNTKILLFSSTLCGPCNIAKRRLKDEEFKHLDVEILDSSIHYEKFVEYKVTSVPTFIKLVEGKEVNRKSGFKDLNDIRSL